MAKKQFEKPLMVIVNLETPDVICTSGNEDLQDGGNIFDNK